MYLSILNEINVEMNKIRMRIVLFFNIWKVARKMKNQIEYNEQVKTLLLTVEALKNAGGLPEEVAEKAEEFCEYLTDYIYGDFFYSYNIDDSKCIEEITYSEN